MLNLRPSISTTDYREATQEQDEEQESQIDPNL